MGCSPLILGTSYSPAGVFPLGVQYTTLSMGVLPHGIFPKKSQLHFVPLSFSLLVHHTVPSGFSYNILSHRVPPPPPLVHHTVPQGFSLLVHHTVQQGLSLLVHHIAPQGFSSWYTILSHRGFPLGTSYCPTGFSLLVHYTVHLGSPQKRPLPLPWERY